MIPLSRVILSAAALALAGCASGADHTPMVFADGAANHPIAVAPEYRALQVQYEGEAGMLPGDEARLIDFASDYLEDGTGSISVTAPAGSDRAVKDISQRLVTMGVPPARILPSLNQGPNPSLIELGYVAYTAHTDACGKWTKDADDTGDNLPMPDFGCAVQHNIAAMVADPRDLVAPRPMGPSDATRRGTIVKQYETGQVTAAQKNQEQQGTVSGVGTGSGGGN